MLFAGYAVNALMSSTYPAAPNAKNPARFPGRAHFFSFNFTNSLICAMASSAVRNGVRSPEKLHSRLICSS
jgi:hypothetical protein